VTDLTDWLTAQIDADETAAKAATPGPWRVNDERYHESILADGEIPTVISGSHWGGDASVFDNDADARHIARWDPARVLAECQAKRDIIALHEPSYSYGPIYKIDGEYQRVPACAMCVNFHADMDCENEHYPCPTLRLLAAPYADAPGYRPEWAPTGAAKPSG